GLWWLAFGRAPLRVRLVSSLLLAVAEAGLVFAAQKDTRFWLVIWGLPGAVAVLTVVLVLLSAAPAGVRYAVATVLTVAAIVPWELVRIEGVTGDFSMDPAWRWTPTAEERVAAFTQDEGTPDQAALPVVAADEHDWPGFRGGNRDGRTAAAAGLGGVWRRRAGAGSGAGRGGVEARWPQG